MAILIRWVLRPQCPVHVCRWKMVVCWALSSLLVEDSGLLGPLQSPNWVKVCLVSTLIFLLVSIEPGVEKCLSLSVGDRVLCREASWPLCRWQGSVSAEPDCRSLQVCLLFVFLSVPHEQAVTGGILKTELPVWQGRSAGPGKGGVKALGHVFWISWVEGL